MAQKQRIEYIDLAKGFCILLVVIFHVRYATGLEATSSLGRHLDGVLVNIRMPFYFFISGIFFKSYGSYTSFLVKKTNKLLIPFLSMFLITVVLYNFYDHIRFGNSLDKVFDNIVGLRPNYPIWFLLSLFEINIIFCFLELYTKNKYIYSLLIAAIGFIILNTGIKLPLFIDTAMTRLPFYVCGIILSRNTDYLRRPFVKKDILRVLVALILILMVCISESLIGSGALFSIVKLFAIGFSGIFVFMTVAKSIVHIPLISYIGRYSIVILCTHYLIIMFMIHHVNHRLPVMPPIVMAMFELSVILATAVPLIKICVKYLPYFFAQKELITINSTKK